MKSRPTTLFMAFAASRIAACGGNAEEGGGGGGFTLPPTAVEVARVESGAVRDVFETVGTINAVESITVVSEIDGKIVSLPFRPVP